MTGNPEDRTQLSLFDGGGWKPRKVKPGPRVHRRPPAKAEQAPLAIKPRFLPVVGVPASRDECPDTSHEHCPYVRCRWNLARLDAEHRAGRPGLSRAPRDANGHILPLDGHLGSEGAGTTVIPRWLELERVCKVWVERGDDGKMLNLHAVYESEWDQFATRLHVGEAIDVMEGEYAVGDMNPRRVMGARLGPTGSVVLEREPDAGLFMLTLVRVRGVESCALDMAKRGKLSNQEIGDGLGRHRTLVAREVKSALGKAGDVAEEMGIDRADLARALMAMGQES